MQNVVTYDAVIDVANPDLELRPGMTANVSFVFAERADVLRVPNAALRFRPPPELLAAQKRDAAGRARRAARPATAAAATRRPPDGGAGRRAGGEPAGATARGIARASRTAGRSGCCAAGDARRRSGSGPGVSDGSTTEVRRGRAARGRRRRHRRRRGAQATAGRRAAARRGGMRRIL